MPLSTIIDSSVLDAFLEQQRRSLSLPGLAVAVVANGQIVYQRSLGDAGPGRPMTLQTPLILGSLSKSFTALAIMRLVEQGKLDLGAPIKRYVPWIRFADAGATSRITVRHLLTHTSGISRHAGRVLLGGRGDKTIEQSVRDLRTLKLSRPVGTAFQYSNTNYQILGLVIEMVSGQPFNEYLQQHIFAPLGMEHSAVSEQEALRRGLATGYRWWFGIPRPFDAPYLPDALPAAFIAASVSDMARYALALLHGGALAGGEVLSPKGVADLLRAAVVTPTAGSSYALGWRVETLGGVSVVRHGGEVSNFLAEMVLLPEQHAGVIVLMNCNNGLVPLALPHAPRLASAVARLLLGQPQPTQHMSVRGFYALLDTALVVLSVLQGWSLLRVFRARAARHSDAQEHQWPARRLLASLLDLAVPLAVWRLLPRRADSPWSLLRVYVPDASAWLAAICSVSLLKVLLRLLPSPTRPKR
jgi:CubicO group peptidase (beta-lactamase class C family)